MSNHGRYPNISSSIRSRAALGSILAGLIILAVSMAAAHAAQVRQSTRDEVKGADQVQSGDALAKRIVEENARLDRLLKGICRGC